MTPLRNTVAVVRTLRFCALAFGRGSSEAEPMPAAEVDSVELVPFNESRWPPAAAVSMFVILDQVVDQAHRRPDRSPVPRSSRQLADASVSAAQ